MRIIVNGLAARSGGAQTYLFNILPRLAANKNNEVAILAYREFAHIFDFKNVRQITPNHKPGNIAARVLWEKFSLPWLIKKEYFDIYFAPGGIIGCKVPKPCKSAVAFRNMLPYAPAEIQRFSFGYTKMRYSLLRWAQASSFRDADLVVFMSAYAKQVIDCYVPDRKGGLVIIHHGVDEIFRKPCESFNFPGLEPGGYVLYVSPFKPYKAQMEIVKSWRGYLKSGGIRYKLVFTGSNNSSYAKKVAYRVKDLGLEDSVIFLGNVPYDDLSYLYQNARINVFASSCENCPNILIECMNSGRPVFCSDIPPMPEIGGEALLYFNPYEPVQLAGLLREFIDDESALTELGEKARLRGAVFDWDRSAKQLYSAFTELTNESEASSLRISA